MQSILHNKQKMRGITKRSFLHTQEILMGGGGKQKVNKLIRVLLLDYILVHVCVLVLCRFTQNKSYY